MLAKALRTKSASIVSSRSVNVKTRVAADKRVSLATSRIDGCVHRFFHTSYAHFESAGTVEPSQSQPGWVANPDDYVLKDCVGLLDKARSDWKFMDEMKTTVKSFRSNGLRSPLVQSTILELQKVDYETWASKVSRTPETSGEFVAWLKQNLPSFLKMASNPTAYLLTPHALFGLVEFLPPKDQWEEMKTEVISQLKEMAMVPVEQVYGMGRAVGASHNSLTWYSLRSTLRDMNYPWGDIEGSTAELTSSWLGASDLQGFSELFKFCGPRTRRQIILAMLTAVVRNNEKQEFWGVALQMQQYADNQLRMHAERASIRRHVGFLGSLVDPAQAAKLLTTPEQQFVALLGSGKPLQAAQNFLDVPEFRETKDSHLRLLMFACMRLAVAETIIKKLPNATQWLNEQLEEWSNYDPTITRALNMYAKIRATTLQSKFLVGCLDLLIKYRDGGFLPTDKEEGEGWNALIALIITERRYYKLPVSSSVINSTIDKLMHIVEHGKLEPREKLKQEAHYALGRLLLAREPLDKDSIYEAISHLKQVIPADDTIDVLRLLSVAHSIVGDYTQSLEYFFKAEKQFGEQAGFFPHVVSDALKANAPETVLKSVVGACVRFHKQQAMFVHFDPEEFIESIQEAMTRLGCAHVSFDMLKYWVELQSTSLTGVGPSRMTREKVAEFERVAKAHAQRQHIRVEPKNVPFHHRSPFVHN